LRQEDRAAAAVEPRLQPGRVVAGARWRDRALHRRPTPRAAGPSGHGSAPVCGEDVSAPRHMRLPCGREAAARGADEPVAPPPATPYVLFALGTLMRTPLMLIRAGTGARMVEWVM